MGLQVWLPFNGNTNNQGLSPITNPLDINTINWVDGKMGKCMYNQDYNGNTMTADGLIGATKFSISCWIKLEQDDTPLYTDFADFIQVIVNADGVSGPIRLEHLPKANMDGHVAAVFYRNKDVMGESTDYVGLALSPTPYYNTHYKWHHEVLTFDGTVAKKYINGEFYSVIDKPDLFKDTYYLTGQFKIATIGSYFKLNDFRIYDHCLSDKEVKEISKGLMLHYPMNEINAISNSQRSIFNTLYKNKDIVDTSGYNNNGTIVSAYFSNDSIVGDGSYKFVKNEGNSIVSNIDLTFGKTFTISYWIKFNNISNSDWDCALEFNATDESRLGYSLGTNSNTFGFHIYDNSTGTRQSIIDKYDYTELVNNKWYYISITADESTIKFYKNGDLISTYNNLELKDFSFNKLSIGRASGVEHFIDANISDLRLYSTTLSDSDIKELYQTRFSLTDNYTLYCNEAIEVDNNTSSFNENGNIIADSINENPDTYDMKIKILPEDGSIWARIFYHNNHAGTVLFSSANDWAEVLECNTSDKYSKLKYIENFRSNIDGKFEFMLCYPIKYATQYNRWKQSDNPCIVKEDVSGSPFPADGYEEVHIDWRHNNFAGILRSSTNNTFIDGATNYSNWSYAIGCAKAWNGGIPDNVTYVADETELWVRINNKSQVCKNSIYMNQIIEN